MGAVFGLFAAFYHWFFIIRAFANKKLHNDSNSPAVCKHTPEYEIRPQLSRYTYRETIGVLHFITPS